MPAYFLEHHQYIELEYNQTRIQKGLGYKTPKQVWFDFYRQAA